MHRLLWHTGVLEVFNEATGNYSTALIVNENPLNKRTEREHETRGCNVSSVAVMAGNGSVVDINSSGFYILLDPLDFSGSIHIQVSFYYNRCQSFYQNF